MATIVRWNPVREIAAMQDVMDRIFEENRRVIKAPHQPAPVRQSNQLRGGRGQKHHEDPGAIDRHATARPDSCVDCSLVAGGQDVRPDLVH